jgi:hypothetical protein
LLMSRTSYTTQFEIDELWVAGDALGLCVEFCREGFAVTVRLPASRVDFRMREISPFNALGAFGHSSSGASHGPHHVQTVRVIQISVAQEVNLGATDDEAHEPDLVGFIDSAKTLARSVAGEFVQWMRVRRGQTWLGMSHSEPPIVGERTLHDDTSGQILSHADSDPVLVRPLPINKALDPALVLDLAGLLGDGHPEVPLADALIADAHYLIGIRPPNPQQALLLAAIGLEVAVKLVLRAKTTDAKRPLVDYILTSPRDVSQQALALFDGTMTVAIGRSLKREDRPLFNRVGKLFEHRNAVAHSGANVPFDEASNLIAAASEALAWLSAL